jgi:hypothetical protein
MATSHDPLGKDQDGQSNVPADVQEIKADFRRDLAFPTLTEGMVQRLHGSAEDYTLPSIRGQGDYTDFGGKTGSKSFD